MEQRTETRTREGLVALMHELGEMPAHENEHVVLDRHFGSDADHRLLGSLRGIPQTIEPGAALLLNAAVATMSERHIAAVAGIGYGYSLFAAMYGNPHKIVYGFDSYTYDAYGRKPAGRAVYKELMKRFKTSRSPKHFVYEADAVGFFLGEHYTHERYWQQAGLYDHWPVGVFFYDAWQEQKDVLSSLQVANNALVAGGLVFVDDVSVQEVNQAVEEFMRINAGQYRVLLNRPVADNPFWGHGLAVLERL